MSKCTSIINLNYPPGSLGSASNPVKFHKEQDFETLKNYYVQRRKMFVDKTFPPNITSLGDIPEFSYAQEAQVKWCRPKEIVDLLKIRGDPVFSKDGESRFDFAQGLVGNCWFLAAISSLTLNKRLKVQVVPAQSFDDYAGIFHFRFWRFGKWVDVVIDDFLPVFQDQFFSVHSKSTNEFWVPLMEKAYAKVCGSYADMNAGYMSEACKDMTGGLSLNFPLQQVHENDHDDQLWTSLSHGAGCKSMMCCGTPSVDNGRIVNSIRDNGLVNAHAYSVTKVSEVYHYGSKVKLVRVLNPWGTQEWNGKWSDNSYLWDQVSREDRAKCVKDDNGEFWMELEDFCNNFTCLSICCENPNFMDGDLGCQWQLTTHEGVFDKAGGSIHYTTFHTNPQFRIQVDIRNEEEELDMNCFVSLMQKPSERNRTKARYILVALNLFKIPPGTKPGRLDRAFFRNNRPIGQEVFAEEREITNWYSLSPGEYVIIPSTMLQYMRAEFVLSIYTKTHMKIQPFEGEDEDEDDHDHDNNHNRDHNGDTDEKVNGEDNLILPEIPVVNEKTDTTEIFEQYADWRGELNARKLQRLLNDQLARGIKGGFSRSTCMDFILQMNTDHKMRMMNFDEFSVLWEKLKKYKQIFLDADINHNGVLDKSEVNRAAQTAGLHFSNRWGDQALFRFSFGSSTLDLQNFLALMMEMDRMTSFFKDHASDGNLILTMDDWFDSNLSF
ncbi:hypothetical protein WMY93_008043 [Mugilogobius chulae]|uniref:Uncharacterized protein n=1 Tax=Mugilogobius chulae TaxID=88201 RepID=A0AAW0PI38_9GOBI